MANILNLDIDNNRIYDNDKEVVYRDLNANTTGGMASDIEDNMTNLAVAARSAMKKKKAKHDFKTSNKSFLSLYNDLYKLGIKNNKFFLKLYDQDLVGVDVYNQILPLDMQMKVLLEIMINPWYYLREICRIPEDGKPIEPGGGTAFIADRNNIASWYCFLNGIDHYDSKSRQLGKTQNAIAEMNYAFHYGAMSATFLFFNKDFPLAKQNLYRLKCQRDMLPTWLQMKIAYNEDGSIDKGRDNITTMSNPINGNTIKVMPKATSKDAAVKLGRGETAAFHYMDELDFTPYNTEIMKAAAFAYARASENASNNGSLYGRCFTSTPGYLSTQAGKDADKLIQRMMVWDDHFYDEPINKIKSILNSSQHNKIMYIEHTWKQLKKPMTWYENQCGLVDYDADTILREIDLQRIQGNERSPFKKSALAHIVRSMRNPIDKLDFSKSLNPILVYEKLNRKIHYILSVDPSEGLGLNNNAFTLINPHTECVAAEFKSPYISPPDFHKLITKFMDKHCPKSLIVIEANRGRELINRFLESKYRYQLWYDTKKLGAKVVETNDKYGKERQSAHERRAFGFDTTTSTKPLLFSIIERFMEEDLGKVYTQYIVKDVTCVQRQPNGKIIMGAGDDDEGVGHGDNLMSYLIGLFVLYNADNLEEFGVYRGASEPIDEDRELTDDEKREKIQSVMGLLPPEMQELFQGVLQETDPVRESFMYQRQVQTELIKQDMELGVEQDEHDMRFVDENMDEQVWLQQQKLIFESNRIGKDDPENMFNIDDWV